jgi:hypothetical protein
MRFICISHRGNTPPLDPPHANTCSDGDVGELVRGAGHLEPQAVCPPQRREGERHFAGAVWKRVSTGQEGTLALFPVGLGKAGESTQMTRDAIYFSFMSIQGEQEGVHGLQVESPVCWQGQYRVRCRGG